VDDADPSLSDRAEEHVPSEDGPVARGGLEGGHGRLERRVLREGDDELTAGAAGLDVSEDPLACLFGKVAGEERDDRGFVEAWAHGSMLLSP